jgi:hypothetical protein
LDLVIDQRAREDIRALRADLKLVQQELIDLQNGLIGADEDSTKSEQRCCRIDDCTLF